MAVRAVFRARRGWGMALDGCGPVGQRPAYWRILKPSPVTTKLPADRSVEDHGDRVVGQDGGSCSAAAPATGSGGGAPRRPPLRQRGGKLGVRGGAAPRQPPHGTHGVWPQGVSWLDHNNSGRSQPRRTPANRYTTPPKTAVTRSRGPTPRPLGRQPSRTASRDRPVTHWRRRLSVPLCRAGMYVSNWREVSGGRQAIADTPLIRGCHRPCSA